MIKEDIEQEQWIYHEDSFLASRVKQLTHWWFTKNGYGLTLNSDSSIEITDDRRHTTFPVVVYRGPCPTVEDLKYICKLLKI